MWAIDENVKGVLGVIGNITALGLILAPLPTIIKISLLRSTQDFSPVPYVASLLNALLWFFYALPFVGEGRFFLLTINSIGATCQLSYVVTFLVLNSPKQRLHTSLCLGGAMAFFAIAATITVTAFHTSDSRSMFLGTVTDVVNVVMYSAPLEIMWIVVRTRSVKFMPFFLSLLVVICSASWTAYGAYVRDIYVLVPNGLGFLLGLAQLILYFLYYRIETQTTVSEQLLPNNDEDLQNENQNP